MKKVKISVKCKSTGRRIKDGFIDFAETEFQCPSCKKKHIDSDDKYLNRADKNKSFITSVKCDCGVKFWLSFEYWGIVSFLRK
jgi:predicted RNA-binding Zn-ribbon protein involved in translation (DUF1610 family)